jgi:hypothetical protein
MRLSRGTQTKRSPCGRRDHCNNAPRRTRAGKSRPRGEDLIVTRRSAHLTVTVLAVALAATPAPANTPVNDARVAAAVGQAASSVTPALERIGSAPDRPPGRARAKALARRWRAVVASAKAQLPMLRQLDPATASGDRARSCALGAIRRISKAARSGRAAYSARARRRPARYRRLLRRAAKASPGLTSLKACAAPLVGVGPPPSAPGPPAAGPAPPPGPATVAPAITLGQFQLANTWGGLWGPLPSGSTFTACEIPDVLVVDFSSTGIAPRGVPTATWRLPWGAVFGPDPIRAFFPDGGGLHSVGFTDGTPLPDGRYEVDLGYNGTRLASGWVEVACE